MSLDLVLFACALKEETTCECLCIPLRPLELLSRLYLHDIWFPLPVVQEYFLAIR